MAQTYEFRPAKAAQRKMIVDASRRLTQIAPFDSYQYVGFGGLEFIDFVEFHRALGIPKMTSIERDTQMQHRLEFNKPYRSIRLLMGEARDQLPEVDWTIPSIVWLDYTDVLTTGVLHDVDFVIRSCCPGSVVIVTINGASSGVRPGDRLDNVRNNLGDLVDDDLSEKDMAGWGPAKVQRGILQARAHTASREAHGLPMRQLFNFHYADGAKMQTWGGIVTSPVMDRTIDTCRFEDLEFIRADEDAFEISVPVFTVREIAFLEEGLAGLHDGALPKIKGVEAGDIKAFARVYRWRAGDR
ncbi:O-methyltransferase [Promicromonospora sp. Populi]|uniref:O-methyltransferase n=1 Tax=Promicromonospora sp. Populi TaxID=3239420 RepID=UPI0034E2946A